MEAIETRHPSGRPVPIIAEEDYSSTSHAEINCIVCHPDSFQYGHAEQGEGDCTQCHTMHDEKVTGDAHIIVDCRACHLEGITPLIDPESELVSWEESKLEGSSRVHHMVITDDEASCRTCHFSGNEVGAASMILPAKSIICMPCHSGTFSVGDITTILSLLIFLAGMVLIFAYLLSGRMRGSGTGGNRFITNSKLLSFLKTMFFDVLLQRRLFRQSGARWFVHSLIFFPFVIRFLWGILALLGSLYMPDVPLVWGMINKNDPITAFLFDITGLILLIGIFSALARGISCGDNQLSGLPKQDRVALFLIAAIVIVGFILEGIRIAMTGWPEGSDYGVVGYALSLLFRGYSGLTELYGYVWYAHALMTGIFIAYLPFSRLIHIVFAPIVLGINAVSENR
jgi:nitrate reductase gamma subunit